jgi:hypothetical protein
MGLSVAAAHMGCKRGVAPLFDWMGTVTGATREWDADDLVTGNITTWTDRSVSAAVQTVNAGNLPKDLGIKGRGRVRYNANWTVGSGTSALDALGSLSGNWMIVVVADLQGVGASNTGDWADTGLVSVANFRGLMGYRKRLTGPDVHAVNGWYYDGSFTPSAFQDFGATLSGPRVYHVRKSGTSIWAGVNGAEGTVATKSSASIDALTALQFGTNPNFSAPANAYFYKVCFKSNGLLDTATNAALASFVAEYS